MPSPNLSEIVTTTLRNRSGKLADSVSDDCGARDIEFSRSLYPSLQNFDAWLAAHTAQIPR
jgi:hypothetical protein